VTFPAPAPANAFLRFGGVGSQIEVSFDGGATWQAAQQQAQQQGYRPSSFGSYWAPTPAGATQASFRGRDGDLPWMVKGISIFAADQPDAVSAPSPRPE
jgi:hypothetical protein